VSAGWDKFAEELRSLVQPTIDNVQGRFRDETRARLHGLMESAAIVAARRVAGHDTRTAEIALEASMANLIVEERLVLQREASDLAMRVALRLAGIAAAAV